MKTFAIALATMMTGCVAVTAHASAPVRNVQQQVVSYADLNLESASDAAILLTRIKFAARKVCGLRNPGVMPLAILDRLETCSAEATARAIADVNSPLLTVRL
jgi:UrcA family protein